ncbi:T6SS immunity protein Tdi1 domain-containing protein [Verrucomicrobiaceae bacterium 227]
MFAQFRDKYGEGEGASDELNLAILSTLEERATGITELLSSSGGATFANGLYRLHGSGDIAGWTKNVEAAFPEYQGAVACFGYDWLGRHFALDARTNEGQWPILLIEPGAGEAMQIPASFADFHNVELVEYASDALSEPFFQEWINSGGGRPRPAECIAYKTPLFLGGSDTIENLEVSDMEVYWHLCGELRGKIAKG